MTASNDSPNGAQERPSSVPWPPLLLGAAVIGAWLLSFAVPLPWPGLDDTPARAVGIGAGIAGGLLMVWAILTLIRHNTTVMPHKAAVHLVTSGPYAYLRNPIYLADVLLLLGLAEVTKNIWLVILAFVFALLVTKLAILPEERHLEARFGEAWRAYAARTRRWL